MRCVTGVYWRDIANTFALECKSSELLSVCVFGVGGWSVNKDKISFHAHIIFKFLLHCLKHSASMSLVCIWRALFSVISYPCTPFHSSYTLVVMVFICNDVLSETCFHSLQGDHHCCNPLNTNIKGCTVVFMIFWVRLLALGRFKRKKVCAYMHSEA